MIGAIVQRRSIRKYTDREVSDSMIREILQAGILAPSSKNRQPWKFVVARGRAKTEAVVVMREGIQRERQTPLLPDSGQHLKAAEYTADIMEQASAVVFLVNPLGADIHRSLSPEERIYEICNAQSIGAAMENMTLAATDRGLGSLWVCDTYFAYQELKQWLHTEGELAAALVIGYRAEEPSARPRKDIDTLTEWRD